MLVGRKGPSVGEAGLTPFNPPSFPEAGRAEEQPMEVSACRSPVPGLSISQEPGEERAARWSRRVGGGWGPALSHPSLPTAVQPVEG